VHSLRLAVRQQRVKTDGRSAPSRPPRWSRLAQCQGNTSSYIIATLSVPCTYLLLPVCTGIYPRRLGVRKAIWQNRLQFAFSPWAFRIATTTVGSGIATKRLTFLCRRLCITGLHWPNCVHRLLPSAIRVAKLSGCEPVRRPKVQAAGYRGTEGPGKSLDPCPRRGPI
jgi:hypothetical protein